MKKIKFYIPTKDNKGEMLAETERNSMIATVSGYFCDSFGGATMLDGKGFYRAQSGEIIAENVQILESSVKRISASTIKDIRSMARTVKATLRQESVMVEFGNTAEFI